MVSSGINAAWLIYNYIVSVLINVSSTHLTMVLGLFGLTWCVSRFCWKYIARFLFMVSSARNSAWLI